MRCGGPVFFKRVFVKIGFFCLTFLVKIGYNFYMFSNIISFVLRMALIVALWAFMWRLVEPRTQFDRIFRAALLLLSLLTVLAVIRIVG